MSIIIRDETANAAVLTIDNNGNIYFGDGTPVSLVTIAGNEIIDNNGFIVHGLGSCSINSSSGSVIVGFDESATITTLPGRVPTVSIDTVYPAKFFSEEVRTGVVISSPLFGTPTHSCDPELGQFAVTNNDGTDIQDPSILEGLSNARCGYRWI